MKDGNDNDSYEWNEAKKNCHHHQQQQINNILAARDGKRNDERKEWPENEKHTWQNSFPLNIYYNKKELSFVLKNWPYFVYVSLYRHHRRHCRRRRPLQKCHNIIRENVCVVLFCTA